MTAAYEEPVARIGIGRILEKVTAMESTLAVQACAIQAIVEDVRELRTSVAALEENRFPWKVIGGIVAVATLILTSIIFLVSQDDPPPPPRKASIGVVDGPR